MTVAAPADERWWSWLALSAVIGLAAVAAPAALHRLDPSAAMVIGFPALAETPDVHPVANRC